MDISKLWVLGVFWIKKICYFCLIKKLLNFFDYVGVLIFEY